MLCSYQEPNYTDSVKKYKELYTRTLDSIKHYSTLTVRTSDKKLHNKYLKLEEYWMDWSKIFFDAYFDALEKEEKQKQEKKDGKYRQT